MLGETSIELQGPEYVLLFEKFVLGFLIFMQVRTRDLDQIQLIDLDPKVRSFS